MTASNGRTASKTRKPAKAADDAEKIVAKMAAEVEARAPMSHMTAESIELLLGLLGQVVISPVDPEAETKLAAARKAGDELRAQLGVAG